MKHSLRAPRHGHRTRSQLSRVCMILALLATWLTPAAATASVEQWQGTEEALRATAHRSFVEPLRRDDGLNQRSSLQGSTDALAPNLTNSQGYAQHFVPATPTDEGWDSGFGYPGMNGGVYDLVFGLDGSLYASGRFTTAGGVSANYIARWDGTSWHPLGTGIAGGIDPDVFALVIGPNGSLYAGGQFTSAGGVMANNIARWDGTAWHPLASGIDNDVYALAFGSDGSLYAGGGFYTAGGVVARNIARWDGTAWHPVGGGMNDSVDALTLGVDGSLYAAGIFTSAGGVNALFIARWDGAAWHSLGGGLGDETYALAVGPDGSLYAGGWFTTAGGVPANHVARWDGSQWHPLDSGLDGLVSALARGFGGSLYAGGQFTSAGGANANFVARWDGTEWHPLGNGVDNAVDALVLGPDSMLYVGGRFSTAGGAPSNCIARWGELPPTAVTLVSFETVTEGIEATPSYLVAALLVLALIAGIAALVRGSPGRKPGNERLP